MTITREELHKGYVIEGLGIKKLGKRYGFGDRHTRKLLIAHDIPIRQPCWESK